MSNRALVHLYLCECEIGGVSANSAIVKFLADEEQENAYPTHLQLQKNRLGDRGTIALAKTLLGMQWLKVLDLRTCGVGEDGVAALCTALMQHKGLERLDIRGNEVYATSGRRLIQLVRHRPSPLVVLTDLEQLPGRISEELLEAMGVRAAAVQSYEDVSSVVYNVVQPTPTPQSLRSACEGLGLPADSPLHVFVQEMERERDHLARLYSRLGNMVLLLAVDVSPSAAIAPLNALDANILHKEELLERTPLVAILDRIVPTWTLPSSEIDNDTSMAPPCCKEGVWKHITAARGVLLKEQWDTIDRLRTTGQDTAPGGWAGSSPTQPDDTTTHVDSPIVLLSRLVRGIAGIGSADIGAPFSEVEAHIDRVYTKIVVEEYEAKRTFALVCQQVGYLIQNYRPIHAAWKKDACVLSRPARVDSAAFVDTTALWFTQQETSAYTLQRLRLVREALAFLPPLMVRFLMDVACEAAVAPLYRAKGATTFVTLMDMMMQSSSSGEAAMAPRVPGLRSVAPPPARLASTVGAPSRLVAGVTAEADAVPLNLCGDIVSLLGSIRTAEHAKQLCRAYGQWLRWQYFTGKVSSPDLAE